MPVNKDDPRPPFAQVANDLREQIRDGRLGEGQKLPSIKELSHEHDVAPMTVQRALGVLRTQGLVVSHQGRGVFVKEGARQTATEQDQLAQEPTTREGALLAEVQALRERLDRLEREKQQGLSHDPGPSPDPGRGLGL